MDRNIESLRREAERNPEAKRAYHAALARAGRIIPLPPSMEMTQLPDRKDRNKWSPLGISLGGPGMSLNAPNRNKQRYFAHLRGVCPRKCRFCRRAGIDRSKPGRRPL